MDGCMDAPSKVDVRLYRLSEVSGFLTFPFKLSGNCMTEEKSGVYAIYECEERERMPDGRDT